jgi:hypothetical protein
MLAPIRPSPIIPSCIAQDCHELAITTPVC